jgi:hypothetical protein
MFICCECCMLSGRGLCDGFITRPEESYRLWRVVVCDQETSKMRRLKPATGVWKIQPHWVVTSRKQTSIRTWKGWCVEWCTARDVAVCGGHIVVNGDVLGAFAKLLKATVNFVMSVRMVLLCSHWTNFS